MRRFLLNRRMFEMLTIILFFDTFSYCFNSQSSDYLQILNMNNNEWIKDVVSYCIIIKFLMKENAKPTKKNFVYF